MHSLSFVLLKVERVTSALMWFFHLFFGFKRDKMLWEPKEGWAVLQKEVMPADDFDGITSDCPKWKNFWYLNYNMCFDPWMWLWTPHYLALYWCV